MSKDWLHFGDIVGHFVSDVKWKKNIYNEI